MFLNCTSPITKMKTATYLRKLLAIRNMKPIKPDENHEQAKATAQATRPPARTSSHSSLATFVWDRQAALHTPDARIL